MPLKTEDTNVTKLPSSDFIAAQYAKYDRHDDTNVVQFDPPLTPSAAGLIDDVIALLEDPVYRLKAEQTIQDALTRFAANEVKRVKSLSRKKVPSRR